MTKPKLHRPGLILPHRWREKLVWRTAWTPGVPLTKYGFPPIRGGSGNFPAAHGLLAGGLTVGTFVETWSVTMDENDVGLGGYSFRQVTSGASASGDAVRATFSASTAGALDVDNASIGVRSGTTENTVDDPLEFLFSGASGFSASAGTTKVSDALIFPYLNTDSHLVIADYGTNGNPRRLGSAGTWYQKSATDSYNVAAPAGFGSFTGRTYHVSKIEVASLV